MPRSLPWLVHGREATDGKSKSRKHSHSRTPSDNDNDKKARPTINETPRKSDSLRLCKPATLQPVKMVLS